METQVQHSLPHECTHGLGFQKPLPNQSQLVWSLLCCLSANSEASSLDEGPDVDDRIRWTEGSGTDNSVTNSNQLQTAWIIVKDMMLTFCNSLYGL